MEYNYECNLDQQNYDEIVKEFKDSPSEEYIDENFELPDDY